MSVDLLVTPNRLFLPGNTHTYDKPLGRPTGPANWRVTMSLIIGAEPSPVRDYLEGNLLPEHRRPGQEYGVVMLESQIMSAMMQVDVDTVRQWRTGKAALPAGMPVYADWLTEDAWEDLIPATTWYPGGAGLLDVYDNVAGGKVTVFEYQVDKAQKYNDRAEPCGEMASMVSFHCDRCHTPDHNDRGERIENNRPCDRAWTAKKARAHARGDLRCEMPDGRMERAVAEFMSERNGRTVTLPSRASSCATDMVGCGGVRQATAVTKRLIADAGRRA
jgi:hypothetical protein